MNRAKSLIAGTVFGAALPGEAWAASDAAGGAPLIAALAVIAGVAVAITAWITVRRQRTAEREAAALKRVKAHLDTLIEATPQAFYAWHADGGETCSERLADWLGTSASAITRFQDLAPYFDPAGFAALEKAVADLHADGTPFSLPLEIVAGGRKVAASGVPLAADGSGGRSHVVWLGDVSEERARTDRLAVAAAQAEAERDRLHEILDSAPFPVWRRADDLSLDWCNKAYGEAVDADPGEAVTAPGIELVSGGTPGMALALARRVAEAGESQSEIRHVVVGSERRALEIVEAPLGRGRGTIGFARDVSDAEEAKVEIKRHIEANAEVLESLTTPIVIHGPDTRLMFFNSAYVALDGLDEDWLAGEPTHGELLEALRERRRLPEQADFPAFKKSRLALYTSLLEPLEEIQHLPDGTSIRSRVSPHPFGGLLFLFEDVTDRLELERARHTLVAVQRATLDNLHEGIAVFGADGRLKLFNASYARIWQIDENQLATEPHVVDVVELAKPLFHMGGDWESLKALVVARATDRTPRFKRLERPDGSVIDYSCVPLPDGNMLNTYFDVTDSVRIERALRERNEALETADRLKSEFIANVSYELRTPLNTIIGFAEILTNEYFGSLSARQKEYSVGILDSSHHLLDLINDILDLASIEAGRMVLELGSFDLHAALASVLALTREPALQESLNVEFDCPPDIGLIEADERRLKQVVFNLMSNAIKFTAPGGTITLGARREAGQIELWVADSGTGIPVEERQRVFARFQKGGGEAERTPGAGLGLSLVKSFVELHGGHVELDSTWGAGTRVTCYLPAKAAPNRALAVAGD